MASIDVSTQLRVSPVCRSTASLAEASRALPQRVDDRRYASTTGTASRSRAYARSDRRSRLAAWCSGSARWRSHTTTSAYAAAHDRNTMSIRSFGSQVVRGSRCRAWRTSLYQASDCKCARSSPKLLSSHATLSCACVPATRAASSTSCCRSWSSHASMRLRFWRPSRCLCAGHL